MDSSVSDPDPTSQIAWPSGRKASGVSRASPTDARSTYTSQLEVNVSRDPLKYSGSAPHPHREGKLPGLKPLTKWNLFTLSLGMAGAQVAWTVELGYAGCVLHSRMLLNMLNFGASAMAHRSSSAWAFLSNSQAWSG